MSSFPPGEIVSDEVRLIEGVTLRGMLRIAEGPMAIELWLKELSWSEPALTDSAPVKLLAPVRIRAPLPLLIKEPPPLIAPAKVLEALVAPRVRLPPPIRVLPPAVSLIWERDWDWPLRSSTASPGTELKCTEAEGESCCEASSRTMPGPLMVRSPGTANTPADLLSTKVPP